MAIMRKRSRHMKFVLDSMLGRLAKWLRTMGYDTHYQQKYRLIELYELVRHDRIFVTRDSKQVNKIGGILLKSDNVGDQVQELRIRLNLRPNPTDWFKRCIICNTILRKANPEYARDLVPEYVFLQNRDKIKFCPHCNRFYWPGTHKKRMILQLKKWGF